MKRRGDGAAAVKKGRVVPAQFASPPCYLHEFEPEEPATGGTRDDAGKPGPSIGNRASTRRRKP
jgi:hypothetical protein